ncbi:MAG: hypothetical protein WD080_10510 [Egibacteraceae bacterium]
MADDARAPEPDGPSRAARWGRKAVMLAVVVVAALLLGRLGGGVDSGPATPAGRPGAAAVAG